MAALLAAFFIATTNGSLNARPKFVAYADAPTLRPDGVPKVDDMLVLAGSFHDHSRDSDGNATSEDVVSWEHAHRRELGIDFAGLSDHADFLPFSYQSPQYGNVWDHQARLEKQYGDGDFAFVRAFEYTSDQENHLGVIGSRGFIAGIHERTVTMGPFYKWLARGDGLGEFNHPSSKGALQWDDMLLDARAAPYMAAIEIYGDQGSDPENLEHSDAGWYWLALVRGWTVGPVMNWDTHEWEEKFAEARPGSDCGRFPYFLPCQRTLVIATSDTRAALLEALRARRTTATEDPGLWATLRGPNGEWQGSLLWDVRPGSRLTLTLDAGSSRWPLSSVDIVSDNGIDPDSYFDGDNLHCGDEAKGCRAEALKFGQVRHSYLIEHDRYLESHGRTLRKRQVDGPPATATIASFPLHGPRTTATLSIVVPNAPSTRPDGRHFFYAIVHAGPGRAWTSPIFTQGPAADM
jgi:hypothetical protein